MEDEVKRFRYGTAVVPFLDHLNQFSVVMDVRKFRAGILSHDVREIIERREAGIATNAPKNDASYLGQVDELRAQYASSFQPLRTYEDVLTQFAPDLHRFVDAAINQTQRLISADEARRMATRIEELPAVRSFVRTQIYLIFHCLVHRTGAGRDKLGDYRHVVEAAYCEALATADRQLAKTVRRINPHLRTLTFETIWGHKPRSRADSS